MLGMSISRSSKDTYSNRSGKPSEILLETWMWGDGAEPVAVGCFTLPSGLGLLHLPLSSSPGLRREHLDAGCDGSAEPAGRGTAR